MKKSISILLVALLLALGLALPPAEPASADIGEVCIDANVIVDPEPVIAGCTVTFTFCVYNCGNVPVVIEDYTSILLVLPPITFPITLGPGEELCWEGSYDTQPEDIGVLQVCCDVAIALLTGEQVVLTICDWVEVLPQGNEVLVDIKPGSFPNSLNVKSKGLLPVAILGTADFDVMQVDPVTMLLGWDGISFVPGVPPLRWAWEDVNEDGWMDLVLKYSMEDLRPITLTHEAPGPLKMTLMGNLMDGTPISGEDTVRIINKGFGGP
jgi:hypothetical protein